MPHPKSKRLVIDACVAGAAGETELPVSSGCRKFLTAVLRNCHRMVMTPAIADEWKRHRSRFSYSWRASMVARRMVVYIADARDADLRARIAASALDRRRQEAMLDDVHLLEAALATERTVASIDDEARKLYRAVSPRVRLLKRVVWVNPVTDSGRVIRWLEGDTGGEAVWQLGA